MQFSLFLNCCQTAQSVSNENVNSEKKRENSIEGGAPRWELPNYFGVAEVKHIRIFHLIRRGSE